jgi:hypothetical protein
MKKSVHRMLGLTGKALAIYLAVEASLWVLLIVAGLAFAFYKTVRHH